MNKIIIIIIIIIIILIIIILIGNRDNGLLRFPTMSYRIFQLIFSLVGSSLEFVRAVGRV